MGTLARQDRLAATARAVVLAYCLLLQSFFAAYFTGAAAAPSLADSVAFGFGICSPSGAPIDGAPLGHAGGARAACLANCLGVLATATPVVAPAADRPVFRIVAVLDGTAALSAPVEVGAAGGLGARAPPILI